MAINRTGLKVLFFYFLIFAASCSKDAAAPDSDKVDVSNFQSYNHDGLSLSYPSHWKLKFDDSPDFSEDRIVVFDVSEGSTATVYIYKSPDKNLAGIGGGFVKDLKLETSEYVKEYKKMPVSVGDFEGLKLSWKDTMMIPFFVEVTILQVVDSPSPVFASFELLEEDIQKETLNFIPFAKSISYIPSK